MTTSADYDAVVVGASIAGCTTATLLGRAGARVAVVEQRPDPAAYKTICTHFIQPSATPTIERLGLAERIEAAGGIRNGLELWTRYGWIRPPIHEDYPHPRYGYDIRRQKLDPMMRELAAETPGVELMLGQNVIALLGGNGRPSGVRTVDRERRERDISARVVIAADGRHSDVAKLSGVRARVLPHGRFGYFAYYRNLPLVSGERTLFWLLDPDVAYAFPQDDDVTLLATFQTKDRAAWFKRDLEANFEAYFTGLPNAPDLAQGERISKVFGQLELPNTARPAARPGLAFVGDAAMAADPLWGVGCGFAFQSGEWLAGELGTAMAGGTSDAQLDEALERYRKRHRSQLLGHFLLTSDYATGRRLNPLERLLFSAAAKDEQCADGFFAFGSRAIRPNDPEFLALVGRAIRVTAARRRAQQVQPLAGAHAEGSSAPAAVNETRLAVDGITTPVSSVGDSDSSEAVVFVHGNPGSRRDWDDLLTRIAPFTRAVAFDMPGFGRADKRKDFNYTVEGYARFLGSGLSQLGIERVHLVLHDFGGPWGLSWAMRNPDQFASVVLIDTGVLLDYRWHYLARIWRTPVAGEVFQATTTRSGLRTALRHGNPRGLPRAFVDRMYDDMDAGTSRAILGLYRATNDPGAAARTMADALRALDRPALVVWGAHDPYIPVAMAERQREAFPSAEVAILNGSGHWPFADDPEAVGRVVEPFLRGRVAERVDVRANLSPPDPGHGCRELGPAVSEPTMGLILKHPGAAVYGTIAVGALLAAESARQETYPETVAAVVLTLVLYWLAHSYADLVERQVEEEAKLTVSGAMAVLVQDLPILIGAGIPLVALLIFWAGGANLSNAVAAGVWTSAAIIMAIEVGAALHARLKGFQLLLQASVGALVGVLIIALRVLLH